MSDRATPQTGHNKNTMVGSAALHPPYGLAATKGFNCISPAQPASGQAINWPSWSSRTGKRLPHQGH